MRTFAELLAVADAVEVHPVRFTPEPTPDNPTSGYYEVIDDPGSEVPFCWSVYLHIPDEGVDCVADCPDEDTANGIANILKERVK